MTYPTTNKVEYGYNIASELETITYKKGTTTLGTLTYTYDLAGNRIKTGGMFAQFNLPPALTTTTYNGNDQEQVFGSMTEDFDLNGNLVTASDTGCDVLGYSCPVILFGLFLLGGLLSPLPDGHGYSYD